MAEQDDEPVQQAEGPVSSEEPSPRGVLSRILPALAGTAAMYGAMQGLGTIATDQGPGAACCRACGSFIVCAG